MAGELFVVLVCWHEVVLVVMVVMVVMVWMVVVSIPTTDNHQHLELVAW